MRLDTRTWALIPLAVAINVSGGWLIGLLKLPIYLDSLGTILVASLCGSLAGVITGFLSSLVVAVLSSPIWLLYAPVGMAVGWLVGVLVKRGLMASPVLATWTGVLVGVCAATLAAPITAFVLQGVSGGGTDLVVAAFRALGFSRFTACLAQSLSVDPLDKVLSCLVIQWILAALPRRTRSSFSQGPALENIRPLALPKFVNRQPGQLARRETPTSATVEQIYQPGQGFLYGLSPTTKVLFSFTCLVAAITWPVFVQLPSKAAACYVLPRPELPLLATVLMFIAVLSGVGPALARITLVTGLPLAISMVVINGAFAWFDPAASSLWKAPELLMALATAMRIIVIIQAVAVTLVTTQPSLLLNDLERHGLPPKLSYVMLASLNLVPATITRAHEIVQAQRARGLSTGTNIIERTWRILPMVIPLLLGAITDVEQRSLALEARGFGSGSKRTWWSVPPRRRWEGFCQLALAGLAIWMIVRLFV